jgi:hydrogenase maturation protease
MMKMLSCSNDTKSNTAPIAIVGAGNWMITYDRIGPKILEMITNRYGPEVALFNTGSSGLALLDCINGQELMLVIDACKCGGPAGRIRIVPADYNSDILQGPSIHQIGPLETLIIAKYLYPQQLPRKVLLILTDTDGMNQAQMEAACRRVIWVLDREILRRRPNCIK